MHFVEKVAEKMREMTDEQLLQARTKIKGTAMFYYKITQEPKIDLTKPRGKSAKDNFERINQVGMMLKAELEKRNIQIPNK